MGILSRLLSEYLDVRDVARERGLLDKTTTPSTLIKQRRHLWDANRCVYCGVLTTTENNLALCPVTADPSTGASSQ